MGHLNEEIEMNKVFAVIDANSAYWTPEGEADYERATFVMAGSPADASPLRRFKVLSPSRMWLAGQRPKGRFGQPVIALAV